MSTGYPNIPPCHLALQDEDQRPGRITHRNQRPGSFRRPIRLVVVSHVILRNVAGSRPPSFARCARRIPDGLHRDGRLQWEVLAAAALSTAGRIAFVPVRLGGQHLPCPSRQHTFHNDSLPRPTVHLNFGNLDPPPPTG